MVFSSVLFTFVFLPPVLGLYYLSKERYRNVLLLAVSLLFYAIGDWKALGIMVVSIVVNYFISLGIGNSKKKNIRKILLISGIFINVGILFSFKYLTYCLSVVQSVLHKNINIPEILLPIGISFFTFQAMSYVIDVYREKAKCEKNILNVGLYISFFPQLVAGPIVRYTSIADQIRQRTVSLEKFGEGATRFIVGFAKKILLANQFAIIADKAFRSDGVQNLPVLLAWFGSIAFSLQIYYDFSGYSDMAIGLGKMFGFDFSENFNYPYVAKSITDFWRRWHISLSQWFRDYVYFPLGGSKKGHVRTILNLLIVWSLTGIWHGANLTFLAWGLMFFVFLIFEKFLFKPEKKIIPIRILWQIITLFVVNIGWILFKAESFSVAKDYIKAMLGLFGNPKCSAETIWLLQENKVFLVCGVLFSMPIIPRIKKFIRSHEKLETISSVVIPIVLGFLLLWSTSYLILGAHNPFIYFNF